MTDAELEELVMLLEDLRLWFNAAPLHLCPTRDALIRGDMDKFYARVEAKCSTIRELRAELEKRDRVVEAARIWAKLSPTDDQLQQREGTLRAALATLDDSA